MSEKRNREKSMGGGWKLCCLAPEALLFPFPPSSFVASSLDFCLVVCFDCAWGRCKLSVPASCYFLRLDDVCERLAVLLFGPWEGSVGRYAPSIAHRSFCFSAEAQPCPKGQEQQRIAIACRESIEMACEIPGCQSEYGIERDASKSHWHWPISVISVA